MVSNNSIRILSNFYGLKFNIEFKVIKYVDGISQEHYYLKLLKPDDEPYEVGVHDYPNVCVRRENTSNVIAVKMMYALNHKNIYQ